MITTIDEQSADIALGVDKALEAKEHTMSEDDIEAIGAGDQGMMFGYASDETEEYMPYPIAMAHKLSRPPDRGKEERHSSVSASRWKDTGDGGV